MSSDNECSGTPGQPEDSPPSKTDDDDNGIRLTKEQTDQLLEELKKKDLEDLDPDPSLPRGSKREMLNEALEELEHSLLQDLIALRRGELRRIYDNSDNKYHHKELPFWMYGLIEIIHILIAGGILALSTTIFHHLGLETTVVHAIDYMHIAIYLLVVTAHMARYATVALGEIKAGMRHLLEQ